MFSKCPMVPELAQSKQSFPINRIMLPGILEGVHCERKLTSEVWKKDDNNRIDRNPTGKCRGLISRESYLAN